MNQNDFEWLTKWYHSQCDGDWEHGNGVSIKTLDNPGWAISINLEGTELEDRAFQEFKIETSEVDWITSRIRNNRFEGFCGPLKLLETVRIFRVWAEGA